MSRPGWVSRYIGKPYAPDGMGPDAFSCWGLVRDVLRLEQDVDLPTFLGDDTSDAARIAAMVCRELPAWRETGPSPGTVILLKPAGIPCHVGVMFSGARFLHSARSPGRVVAATVGGPWCHPNTVVGYFRYVGGRA